MKLALTSLAAVAIALGAAASASATTTLAGPATFSFGNVTPAAGGASTTFDSANTYTNAGTYTSYYQFQLTANAILAFSSYTDAGSSALYGNNAAVLYSGYCTTNCGTGIFTQMKASGATQTTGYGSENFGLSGTMNTGQYTIGVTGNVQQADVGSLSGNFKFTSPVPEAATWGLMVIGFGAIGGALRTSRRKTVFA